MPKLKVNNIVSFSTEDPVHSANNLLLNDTNKKWKCHSPGEKSANIILQLETPSKITGIDIGNEHSAYVEVLVNRSSKPDDDFNVLLVMSSFMSPLEARQSTNVNKVRMFSYQELQNPERDQKWDRVKIVCTQPFNRHVQYGLSFITLHTSENKDNNTDTPGKLGNFLIRPKSPDVLSVGSLFARRKQLTNDTPVSAAVAIREASSSPSLKQNSTQCKPQLKDGTSPSTIKKGSSTSINSDNQRPRNRDELLYKEEEEKPHAKIDKLIEDKNKESKEKQIREEETKKKQKNSTKKTDSKLDSPSTSKTSQSKDGNKRKFNGKDTPHKKIKTNKLCKPFNELLNGVTLVISGIQNPERGVIRSDALAMGAKYKPDWDNTCTHLICAFANTPKFNQVRGKGKIVNKNWISSCYSERKRLPWRRFALDNKDKNKDESEEEIWEQKEKSPEVQIVYNRSSRDEDDVDTEDEIERIEALQKTKNETGSYSAETDEEIIEIPSTSSTSVPELPAFFSSKVLYVDKELNDSVKSMLVRYITAFSGVLVGEPSDIVDYAISSPKSADMLSILCPDAHIVNPDWIWECHCLKKLVPIDKYKLQ
ncbi:hypothetical protein ILUMI_07403 [Ignelater luminosus]|uniref:BRCT domain-containing protein n=1 Tax=Ignelater luminosus TaxID=2038154 RepID=A0A8K0GBM9_IGNLU|nr:hypothetical protein ILUMI_07403 [Ignelater luminosus]